MEEEGEEEKSATTSETPAADEPGTSGGGGGGGGSGSGSGRFYDCIFCKRGFTTAQALGGHMNIHRKDRARLRPAGASTSGQRKGEDAYHPYSRAAPRQSAEPPYAVYFPPSSAEASRRRPTELVQAGEELRLRPGGSDRNEEKEKGKKEEDLNLDLDLDLELRLGHSKSHESSSD